MSAPVSLRTSGGFGTFTNDAYDVVVECERIFNLFAPDLKVYKGLRPFGKDTPAGKVAFPCLMIDMDRIMQDQHNVGKTRVFYTLEFWWFVHQHSGEDLLKRTLEVGQFIGKVFSNDAYGELQAGYGSGGYGTGGYGGGADPTYKYINNAPFWIDAQIRSYVISKPFLSPISSRPGQMRGGMCTVQLENSVIK